MLDYKYLTYLDSIMGFYSNFEYNLFSSLEELVEAYNYSKYDIARMVFFGNLRWDDDYFYIDDCENISSISEYQYFKMLDEYAFGILDEFEKNTGRIDDYDYKMIKEIRKIKMEES